MHNQVANSVSAQLSISGSELQEETVERVKINLEYVSQELKELKTKVLALKDDLMAKTQL